MIFLLPSCRQGYKIEDGKVYYEYWNEGNGQGEWLLEKADANTFQIVDFVNCDCSFKFGKDINHLYINGKIIENIDPLTFRFIGNYIFSDKDSAYFFGFYNDLNDCAIKGIEPNKIKLLKYPWAKAGNILIHGGDTIILDNVNDFIPIDEDWGKTNKYVINNNRIIYGADVETFKVINSFTGKDKDYNYRRGYIAKDELNEKYFKNFDFNKIDICKLEPTEFVDIYENLEPFTEDQNNRIEVVEKLKSNGFTVLKIVRRNSGESKIISAVLTNNSCNCYVDKFYKYDYSKPHTPNIKYKITEKIHCRTRKLELPLTSD